MSKALTITAPAESAADLASRLGVSKARSRRIFSMVARTGKKHGQVRFRMKGSKNGSLKAASSISRSRKRANAKNAKSSR